MLRCECGAPVEIEDGSDPDADHEHGELHKPENEELREAFEALLSLSNHPLGPRPVTVDEAKDQLYSQSCKKASVKRRLLKPLAELGFITVRGGRLVVNRRTAEQVTALKAEADAEFDRLNVTSRQPSQSFRESYAPAHQELLKYRRSGLTPPMECIGWVSNQILWSDEGGASA